MTSQDSNHSIDAEAPIPESGGAELHIDVKPHEGADLDGAELDDDAELNDDAEFNAGAELNEGAADLNDGAELNSAIEALLLVVDTPVTTDALAAATNQPAPRVAEALHVLADALTARDSGMELREAGGGWRMYTRAKFAPYVEKLLIDGARSKLTRAALETLAVVAYRQPVTRARVSAVRGVNVDAVVRTLLARGLIAEARGDVIAASASFEEALANDPRFEPAR
ncbi:MAG: SMC-Scp complex subunit ScpB, partial [Mycobacterium sp.]